MAVFRFPSPHHIQIAMIVFNLSCSHQHSFEGWFASGDEYERQSGLGLVTCPVCGDHEVSRMPAGLHVRRTVAEPVSETEKGVASLMQGLKALLESSEDVGEKFAEEARRIHHDEAPARNIRGVTSLDEAGELLEEGIPVLPLFTPAKKDIH